MNTRTKTTLSLICAGILIPALCWASVEVGTSAPDFSLKDANGQERSLSEFEGKYIVLEWFNPECPFVKKHYNSGNMQGLQEKYTGQEVAWLSIDSSAEGNQGYLTPEEAGEFVDEKQVKSTAILLDHDGTVGKLYGAKTTPHMFIIDPEGTLVYQGAIDDVPSTDAEDIEGAKNYVDETLSLALSGQDVSAYSTKSYGCSVKY